MSFPTVCKRALSRGRLWPGIRSSSSSSFSSSRPPVSSSSTALPPLAVKRQNQESSGANHWRVRNHLSSLSTSSSSPFQQSFSAVIVGAQNERRAQETRRYFSSSSSNNNDNDDIAASQTGTPPIHSCEVLSLGDAKVGKVKEILAPAGTAVEPNQVVAILSSKQNDGQVKTHEIPSPVRGIVTSILVPVDTEIRVGEALFLIKPNASNSMDDNVVVEQQQQAEQEEEPPHHTAAKLLIQHIRDNQGEISNEYLQNEILDQADAQTLLHLAKLLRQQIPHLRPRALTLLERAVSLQEEEQLQKDAEALKTNHDNAGSESDLTHISDLANTHTELGILHHQLGDSAMALSCIRHALELRQQYLGESHPETAATHVHLAMLFQQAGQFAEAVHSWQTALKIQMEKTQGQDHPIVASTHNHLGALFYRTAQFDEAVDHYTKALNMYQSVHKGDDHQDVAGMYNNLAMAIKFQQQHRQQQQQTPGDSSALAKAAEYCQKALQIRSKLLGARHADTAASHYSLAQLLLDTQQLDAALEQYRMACDIQQELYGADSAIVAATLNNIGAVLYQTKDIDGALQEYAKALEILQQLKEKEEQQEGQSSSSVLTSNSRADLAGILNNMANAQADKGDVTAAIESHEQAKVVLLELKEQLLSLQQQQPSLQEPTLAARLEVTLDQLATTMGSIGNIYKSQNNLESALNSFQEAHVILEEQQQQQQDGGHARRNNLAASRNNIGLTLTGLQRFGEAATAFEEARGIFADLLGPEHAHVASCHFNLGLCRVSAALQAAESSSNNNNDSSSTMINDEGRDAAAKEFGAAQAIWMKTLGLDHAQTKLAMKYAQDPLLALQKR